MYRDSEGEIWADSILGGLVNVISGDGEGDDGTVGDVFDPDYVERVWGPLVPVRPTGWEAL
jgi:hypothetical protein